MTEERLVLAELLEKAGESDFLRAVAEAVDILVRDVHRAERPGPVKRHGVLESKATRCGP